MDHIPRVSGNLDQLPTIQYLPCDAAACFDGCGNDSFVERFCSTICDFPSDQAAIAQDWLFFGTLARLADLHAFEYDAVHFRTTLPDGQMLVTTQRLGEYQARWVVNATKRYHRILMRSERTVPDLLISFPGDLVKTLKNDPWALDELSTRSLVILETVAESLLRVQEFGIPIDRDVQDSIVVLCTTLLSTIHFLFRGLLMRTFRDHVARVQQLFHTDLTVKRTTMLFESNGWCRRGALLVRELLDNDPCAVLFCAQLNQQQDVSRRPRGYPIQIRSTMSRCHIRG